MKIPVNEGDTLARIAQQYTLDAAYAPAIAEVNGMYMDDGVTPYDANLPIPTIIFSELEIPETWIKQTEKFWVYVAIIGVLGFLARA